jgi:hypothetical protein
VAAAAAHLATVEAAAGAERAMLHRSLSEARQAGEAEAVRREQAEAAREEAERREEQNRAALHEELEVLRAQLCESERAAAAAGFAVTPVATRSTGVTLSPADAVGGVLEESSVQAGAVATPHKLTSPSVSARVAPLPPGIVDTMLAHARHVVPCMPH